MTSGFDDRPFSEGGNMVGEGGFGTVYYGKFNGGHECAVKKLKQVSQQSVDGLICLLFICLFIESMFDGFMNRSSSNLVQGSDEQSWRTIKSKKASYKLLVET